MRGHTFSFRVGGHTLTLDGRYFSGARELYGRGVYLPSAEFTIGPDDKVVDIGANAGLFTLLACASGATVIAIEAQDGFSDEIAHNLALNHLAGRATIVTALIGADKGVFPNPTAVLSGSHGHTAPPIAELGALLDDHGFERVDLLKVDIEGSEFALFSGELGWLGRVKRIAMEVHPRHGDVSALAELLSRRGFRIRVTDDRGHDTKAPADSGGYLYAVRIQA